VTKRTQKNGFQAGSQATFRFSADPDETLKAPLGQLFHWHGG